MEKDVPDKNDFNQVKTWEEKKKYTWEGFKYTE